eukprot:s777_g3.t1
MSLAPCRKAKTPLLYRNYEALEKLRGKDAHALIKEIQSINSYQCSLPGHVSARGLDSSRRGPKDGRLKSGCRRLDERMPSIEIRKQNQKTSKNNTSIVLILSPCLFHRSDLPGSVTL